MAWYDNLLQRGTNYFTGNNLTSQDPNTIRAMNAQPFNPNAVISDSGGVHQGTSPVSFSDLSYQDLGGVHPRLALPTQTRNLNYNIHRDPPRDWREDIDINYSNAYPRPHQMNMADVSGQVGEYGQIPGQGNVDMYTPKKGFKFPNIGITGILRSAAEKFKDNPEEAFGRNYFNLTDTGRIAGSPATDLYSGTNVSSMFGQGADAAGQKRINTIQGTLDKWEEDPKKYAAQLKRTTLYDRLKEFKNQQKIYQNKLNAQTGRVDTPVITSQGDQVTTGGGQRDTSGWDSPGYSTRGGFAPRQTAASQHAGAGATRDVRGHHSWADGGRIGYQGGELVGQETDFIQGPQGTDEFQETVVEGQEQPSREQLEALAMEIFQLPLEELDDQQLLVVYQEAMQGQPMEEAVQEEDVQFAANGGLASLL